VCARLPTSESLVAVAPLCGTHVRAAAPGSMMATIMTTLGWLVFLLLLSSSGKIIVPAAAAAAAAVTRFPAAQRAVYDVRTFGAKGDGVTYDTAAVRQAAAAIATAGGGTLLFPSSSQRQQGATNSSSSLSVYLTGAFNVSSNTYVEIQRGATVLGSVRGADWPLLHAATVWPQFGHGSDCVPGEESCRLMHQALLFSWNTTNVSLGGGGTFDCNSQKDTWWACARDLKKPPCNGYGRPHCMMFSNVSDVVVSWLHITNSPGATERLACLPAWFASLTDQSWCFATNLTRAWRVCLRLRLDHALLFCYKFTRA
jgi:polygalacturonase